MDQQTTNTTESEPKLYASWRTTSASDCVPSDVAISRLADIIAERVKEGLSDDVDAAIDCFEFDDDGTALSWRAAVWQAMDATQRRRVRAAAETLIASDPLKPWTHMCALRLGINGAAPIADVAGALRGVADALEALQTDRPGSKSTNRGTVSAGDRAVFWYAELTYEPED